MIDVLTLRPIQPADAAFLFEVYANTRAEELAALNWSDAEKDAFLHLQFAAQDRHYQSHFPSADFQVVEVAGKPVGRLYLDRRTDGLHILDIALLMAFRGKGIGTQLLADVLSEAEAIEKPVTLYVERFNRAFQWYRRLGFVELDDAGVYLLLSKRPRVGGLAEAPG